MNYLKMYAAIADSSLEGYVVYDDVSTESVSSTVIDKLRKIVKWLGEKIKQFKDWVVSFIKILFNKGRKVEDIIKTKSENEILTLMSPKRMEMSHASDSIKSLSITAEESINELGLSDIFWESDKLREERVKIHEASSDLMEYCEFLGKLFVNGDLSSISNLNAIGNNYRNRVDLKLLGKDIYAMQLLDNKVLKFEGIAKLDFTAAEDKKDIKVTKDTLLANLNRLLVTLKNEEKYGEEDREHLNKLMKLLGKTRLVENADTLSSEYKPEMLSLQCVYLNQALIPNNLIIKEINRVFNSLYKLLNGKR